LDRSPLVPALVLVAALSHPALAQDRQRDEKAPNVPAHLQPAAGMCRVWLKDVPAAHQPAPTECAVAIRNRPPDAVVLFGKDATTRDMRGMTPSWGSRSGFAPANRGAVQGAQTLRVGAPEPAVAPQITPARVARPKPEKPQ
jgi:hypothetical protein